MPESVHPSGAALNRAQVASWCLYDFANSTYSAVIMAVVFPVYYTSYIVGNGAGLGDLWWSRAVSLSMMTVALISPLLGGLSDYAGFRKKFLILFTAMSVSAIAAMSGLEKGMVMAGFALVVIANIGMEGALVFYNSYLPEIAPRTHQGRVSAWGFGVGYAGSILALVGAIPLVRADMFRELWVLVAVLFAVFAIPAFFKLPPDRKLHGIFESISKSMSYTLRTLKQIFADREARKFLLGYLIYADGVNTVIVFSSIFASTTLGFATSELILLYIIVQATALGGAFVMAHRVDTWGPRKVVLTSLVLWSIVCLAGYFVQDKSQFWPVAIIAGLGLGVVQAASRAFYAQFIPHGREAEYFGVYALAGKTSAVMGPLLFGYVSVAFGSQRPAILSITLFFVTGMALVWAVRGGGPNVKARQT